MSFSADATRIALPRGKILFARKNASAVLGPYLFLGDCPKFDFATMGDTLAEVMDFTSTSASPLARIVKSRIPEFTISLYEYNMNNLALAIMGSAPTEYTQAATPIVAEPLQGGVQVGAIYKTALMGPISSVAVKKGATVFTVNTNYVIRDVNQGVIEIISLPGGVSVGDAITIDYTPTAYITGSGFQQVLGGTQTRIEGQLLYLGTSVNGPRHNLTIWNCAVTSDANFPLIAADPAEFSLKVSVLSDPNHTDLFRLFETDNGSGIPLP
jgi:hypothetical protein